MKCSPYSAVISVPVPIQAWLEQFNSTTPDKIAQIYLLPFAPLGDGECAGDGNGDDDDDG